MPQLMDYLKTNPIVFLNRQMVLMYLNRFYSRVDQETMANYFCAFYLTEKARMHFNPSENFDERLTVRANHRADIQKLEKLKLDKIQFYFGPVTDYLFINECSNVTEFQKVSKMVDEIQVCFHWVGLKWMIFFGLLTK